MAHSSDSAHDYEAIWPGLEAGVPKPLMPYSPAIRAGQWLFVAGFIASDFKTGIAPEVRRIVEANPFAASEIDVQGRFVLETLANTIRASGFDMRSDMVRMWEWLVGEHPTPAAFAVGDNWLDLELAAWQRSRSQIVGRQAPPLSSLGVRELLCRGTRIEIDMICRKDGSERVETAAEPGEGNPAGSSPAGVRRGDWVFLASRSAANCGVDSCWDSPVERQLDRVLEKLSATAAQLGASLGNAVKADVYIGHPRDFAEVDVAWRRWFPQDPPARVVVPYAGMGERGSRVEVALTLLADGSKLRRQAIVAAETPRPLGHEPQAMLAGDLLFFSTQMAFDSSGGLAAGMVRRPEFPWYGLPAQAQMRYMMGNVSRICRAAGTSVDRITRRVCYHSDFAWFAESIQEWASWFPGDKPASTTLRLGGPLVVPGADTLLDLIAYAPER